MNDDRETERAAVAGSDGKSSPVEDQKLLPYRNWALQSNLASVFDSGTMWSGPPSDLGLAADTADTTGRGQTELLRELEADSEWKLRTRTALTLWATALFTVTLSQVALFGLDMPGWAFSASVCAIVVAIVITAITYPRLRPGVLVVVDQLMLALAYALIVFQCQQTDGAESPFASWWLFSSFYTAHFLPPWRAYVNTIVATGLALAPVAYDGSAGGADSIATLTMLVIVIWALTSSILAGREQERAAIRAERYLALADSLTGVANLRAFERVIESATRGGQQQFSLVVVDMNGLKGANAAFGHQVGDDMLIRLTALMRYACEEPAQVARMRGEEFAVYLPGAGAEATQRWCERFEQALATHNNWVRNRLPQISATVGFAVYPLDGARASQLFDHADRQLLAVKSNLVQPPHEVKVSTAAAAEQLLRPPPDLGDRRLGGIVGATQNLCVRWTFGAVVFGGYFAFGGDALRYPLGLLAVAAFCLALGIACFILRGSKSDRVIAGISDIASVLLIFPILWTTGGWQSPLQLTVFFPIVFYAQFLSGWRAIVRAVAVIASYSIAFWGGGALGVAVSPVTPAGESLFITVLAAQIVLTTILHTSRRVTDQAMRRIHDAATRDPLTGMKNVHAFREDLHAMVDAAAYSPADARRIAPAGVEGLQPLPALSIADIDDFRGLSNRGGHQAGEAVLLAVAERLQAAVGDLATAYHIDCDEFAVLFKVDERAQALELTQSVRTAITSDPDAQPRFDRPVHFSFGTAVWQPGATADSLVDDAVRELMAMRAAGGVEPRRGGTVLL